MKVLRIPTTELCDRFWSEVYPAITSQMETENRRVAGMIFKELTPAQLSARGPSAIVAEETARLLREELYAVSHGYFSTPTSFMMRLHEAQIRHVATAKRCFLGPNAARPIQGFERYDVEEDIRITTRDAQTILEGSHTLERNFLKALEGKNYSDARTFLEAIRASRRNETLDPFIVEVRNWQFELACHTGDIDSYMSAWNEIPDVAEADINLLHSQIHTLLYAGPLRGIGVVLSRDGQVAAQRQGVKTEVFANEQAQIFHRSMIEGIAESLIGGGVHTGNDLKDCVRRAATVSRSSSLRTNPYLADIRIVWK